MLDAKAEVQNDALAHAPVVLDESAEVVEDVLQGSGPGQLAPGGKAKEEVRERVAGFRIRVRRVRPAGETGVEIEAPRGRAGNEDVVADPPVFRAQLEEVGR